MGESRPQSRGDPSFGKRMQKACERSTTIPKKNHGLFSFIRDELSRKHDVTVTLETVRKWYTGETVPRRDKMDALSEILRVDPTWLANGFRGLDELCARRGALSGPDAGAVRIVAGLIEMNGFPIAFMEEGRPQPERAHFQTSLDGRDHLVFVADGVPKELDGRRVCDFTAPPLTEHVTCVGLVTTSTVSFDLIRLPVELFSMLGEPTIVPDELHLEAVWDNRGWRIGAVVLRPVSDIRELLDAGRAPAKTTGR